MANFTLHPQLAADTVLVGDLPLSQLLLMKNTHFPWLVLVPRKMRSSSEAVAQEKFGLRELFDLEPDDYNALMQEIRYVSQALQAYSKADKMNVAALGNMVPQLHIHIIARFKTDKAWPNPVWNTGLDSLPYSEAALAERINDLKTLLLASQ